MARSKVPEASSGAEPVTLIVPARPSATEAATLARRPSSRPLAAMSIGGEIGPQCHHDGACRQSEVGFALAHQWCQASTVDLGYDGHRAVLDPAEFSGVASQLLAGDDEQQATVDKGAAEVGMTFGFYTIVVRKVERPTRFRNPELGSSGVFFEFGEHLSRRTSRLERRAVD